MKKDGGTQGKRGERLLKNSKYISSHNILCARTFGGFYFSTIFYFCPCTSLRARRTHAHTLGRLDELRLQRREKAAACHWRGDWGARLSASTRPPAAMDRGAAGGAAERGRRPGGRAAGALTPLSLLRLENSQALKAQSFRGADTLRDTRADEFN